MVDDRTLWLRVKRPHSESPVECFNAIPSKRIRRSAESLGFTRFKYLGTSSSPADSTGISLEDLKDMGASGERKIILGRKNAAHIVDSSENAMQCEVGNILLSSFVILHFIFNNYALNLDWIKSIAY